MGIFSISLANFGYTVCNTLINLGYIGKNFGHFGKFFSGIMVYNYPPWPTLLNVEILLYEQGAVKRSADDSTQPDAKRTRSSSQVQ